MNSDGEVIWGLFGNLVAATRRSRLDVIGILEWGPFNATRTAGERATYCRSNESEMRCVARRRGRGQKRYFQRPAPRGDRLIKFTYAVDY